MEFVVDTIDQPKPAKCPVCDFGLGAGRLCLITIQDCSPEQPDSEYFGSVGRREWLCLPCAKSLEAWLVGAGWKESAKGDRWKDIAYKYFAEDMRAD